MAEPRKSNPDCSARLRVAGHWRSAMFAAFVFA
jgi:hypothetical protein